MKWVHMLYPSPGVGAPDVIVVDVPPEWRGRGLALDRYYAIIIETDAEREEVELYLSAPQSRPVAPDLLDHRPSNIQADDVVISRYDPPDRGWPWLSVTRWPDRYAEAACVRGVTMARGHYTMEMFEAADGLEAHSTAMIEALAGHHPMEVRFLSADQISAGGHA